MTFALFRQSVAAAWAGLRGTTWMAALILGGSWLTFVLDKMSDTTFSEMVRFSICVAGGGLAAFVVLVGGLMFLDRPKRGES